MAEGGETVDKVSGIVKLNRKNYKTWVFNVRLELKDRKLWEAVSTTDDLAFDDIPEETKDRAYRLVARTLTEDIQESILDITCPRALWQKLASRFQPKTRLRRLQASKSLYSAKMLINEDMETYIHRVQSYTSEIVKAGSERIHEEQVCNVILNGLPEEYETTVSMICTFDDADYTPEKVESILCGEFKRKEMKRKEEESNDESKNVLLSRRDFKPRNFSQKIECYNCGKEGHMARFCRQRKKIEEDKSTKDKKLLNVVCLNVASALRDNEWLLDSGASCHFSPNRSDFKEYRKCDNQQVVSLASKTNCTIVGVGRVEIVSKTVDGTFQVTFEEVYHVPEFNFRLLSIATIERKGYCVIFQKGVCQVFDSERKLIIEAARNDANMYSLRNFKSAVCLLTRENKKSWHQRLGHVNQNLIRDMYKREAVRGLDNDVLREQVNSTCEACVKGKNTRKPFPKISGMVTTKVLELIHSDVCCLPIESNSGFKYFVSFIDDFSRRAVVYFMKRKHEVLKYFKRFKWLVENQTGENIKCLRTDNGREYVSNAFEQELERCGITRQLSCPYSPQQNGVAERFNRTMLDLTRTMLIASHAPKRFWAEALNTACYVKNRCPLDNGKTPEEIWTGNKPSVKHMKPFGCKAFAHVPAGLRKKLDDRAIVCALLGYSGAAKGYRLWDITNSKLLISRDVKFEENEFPFIKENKSTEEYSDLESMNTLQNQREEINVVEEAIILMDQQEEEQGHALEDRRRQEEEHGQDENEQESEGEENAEEQGTENRDRNHRMTLRDRSQIKKPDRYCANSIEKKDPKTYKEAMSGEDRDLWAAAIQEELNSLETMQVWELADLPPGKTAVGCKWVFRIKYLADGSVERYKARLVAQGFSQREGIDYNETYSPVISLPAIRLILKLAMKNEWLIHQMDVKTAYLNGILKEEIYMKLPEGLMENQSDRRVCRLLKSLYGLRQSGCLGQTKPPTVTIQVPSIVKNGSEAVILDCMYTFEKWNPLAPAEEGLVVKWFFNDQLVYQWIAGDPPQAAGVLTGRLNPDFTISNEPAQMYRAIQILTPTSDLTGDYYCFVASFSSEAPSVKKRMTVYVPETEMLLYTPRRSSSSKDHKFEVRCEAHGVYPEPNMTIASRERLEPRDDVSVHIETKNGDGLFNIKAWIEMTDRGDGNSLTFDCILRIPDANYTVHKSIIYYPVFTTTTTTTTTTTSTTTRPPRSYRTTPRATSNRTVRTHYLDPDLFRGTGECKDTEPIDGDTNSASWLLPTTTVLITLLLSTIL